MSWKVFPKYYNHMRKDVITTQKIETANAPAAIGPYPQAFQVNGFLFTSGQIPIDLVSGKVPEGIAAQAAQSCQNIQAILEAAGSSLEKVIKTTYFLSDIGNFSEFNDVYVRYFTGNPAYSCVAVKQLPKNVLCEIEAIAEV